MEPDIGLVGGPGGPQALVVVYRPVNELLPYARNARTHTETQVAEIAGSIRAFGFTNPILIRGDGVIVAGHGRVLAARLLGMELVPTIELRGLTEVQARALTLADNRIALNAGWDVEMLSLELLDLRELGADLQVLGFSPAELAAALEPPTQGLTHPDAVPPAPELPVSRAGDVWKLGRHRLMCGDSTVADDVRRLLVTTAPPLMVTDPPYGVNYDATWRRTAIEDDGSRSEGRVLNDHTADWRAAYFLFPGDVAYVWHAGLHASEVQEGLISAGFLIRAQIIWKKQHAPMSRGAYHWQHEPCWYAVRKGRPGNWNGNRKQTTVWDIANAAGIGGQADDMRTGHSTQKPVECMRRPMENNSAPGQAVYEPFAGSGTTIIAAEQISRACFAMEVARSYVDVGVLRWQAFTGLPATLEGTNETYEAVAARRAGEPA